MWLVNGVFFPKYPGDMSRQALPVQAMAMIGAMSRSHHRDHRAVRTDAVACRICRGTIESVPLVALSCRSVPCRAP